MGEGADSELQGEVLINQSTEAASVTEPAQRALDETQNYALDRILGKLHVEQQQLSVILAWLAGKGGLVGSCYQREGPGRLIGH